jgi:hypothetical protein
MASETNREIVQHEGASGHADTPGLVPAADRVPVPFREALRPMVLRFSADLKALCQARGGVYAVEAAAVEDAEVLWTDGHGEAGTQALFAALQRVITYEEGRTIHG